MAEQEMSAPGRAAGTGIALRIARFAALVLFAFCLTMYIYANAVVIASASTNLNAIRQSNAWTDDAVRDAVAQIGVSVTALNVYFLLTRAIQAVCMVAVGGVIFWHRRGDWFSLYVGILFFIFGTLSQGNVTSSVAGQPVLLAVVRALSNAGWIGLFPLFYLFPNGRFAPGWTRWLMVFVAVFIVIIGLSQGGVLQIPPVLDALMMVGALGLFGGGLASQVYRYFRRSDAIEKQQTKWIIAAIGLFVLSVVVGLGNLLVVGPQQRGMATELLGSIVLAPFFSLASATLPLSVGIAILRYRLWDIDVIVRRTVTYAIVSAALAVVYFGANIIAQGVIGALGGQRNEVAIVASTLAVAALFSPVRRRVQDAIDRRFNRQRYDADKVVADFAEYAAKETNLAALQARIVGVVAKTIQPKQVTMWVRGNTVTLSERSSARLDSDL
ncbi:MAG TPA: hypothetical protein PLQ83_15300 [Thermoflexales bacterium]|nr:hypothetical protein [Thermoflexales bacterium]